MAFLDLDQASYRIPRSSVLEMKIRNLGIKLTQVIKGLYRMNRTYVLINGLETQESIIHNRI